MWHWKRLVPSAEDNKLHSVLRKHPKLPTQYRLISEAEQDERENQLMNNLLNEEDPSIPCAPVGECMAKGERLSDVGHNISQPFVPLSKEEVEIWGSDE
ncbi:hypothetical protein N7536_012510 [Penicillium majusculum]|nr:hypothetical protein N7536_012510 [Penicillium majusculum]